MSTIHGASIHVVASGHAHPTTSLTSEVLESSVPGLRTGWIDGQLGIVSRRVLAAHEHLSSLGIAAVDDALAAAGWDGHSLDALICATSFVDDILPATAAFISRDINPSAVAFDVNAACASFPVAMAVAESMMLGRPDMDRVAVCAAERPTAWADYQDRESSIFWGDSAGCVLLQRARPEQGFRIVEVALVNDSEYPEKVRVRSHGTFHHDGRYSYEQVLALTEKSTREVLKSAGIAANEVRAFVGHQSNLRLLAALGDRLGIEWEHQWHNVEWAGNQAGAGVVTAFSAGWRSLAAPLEPGDHVLLAAVGGGYSGGAVLLEWIGADV